jgi:hypothetical protein
MIRAIRNVAALHLAGNALLLAIGYYWLGTPESGALTLSWSALVLLALVSSACWLHAGTLLYFREGRGAFRRILGRLLPVVVLAIVLIGVYLLLARWEEYSMKPASSLASWFTMKLRRPVKPAAMLAIFNAALWLLRWVVVPVFALPLVSNVASEGWTGLRSFGHVARNWRYWVVTVILMWCAFIAPLKLMSWVPSAAGFAMEMASFLARALAAYLLFNGGWLALLFLTSVGKPVFSQPSTAARP